LLKTGPMQQRFLAIISGVGNPGAKPWHARGGGPFAASKERNDLGDVREPPTRVFASGPRTGDVCGRGWARQQKSDPLIAFRRSRVGNIPSNADDHQRDDDILSGAGRRLRWRQRAAEGKLSPNRNASASYDVHQHWTEGTSGSPTHPRPSAASGQGLYEGDRRLRRGIMLRTTPRDTTARQVEAAGGADLQRAGNFTSTEKW